MQRLFKKLIILVVMLLLSWPLVEDLAVQQATSRQAVAVLGHAQT
jgi:hypothetical protein